MEAFDWALDFTFRWEGGYVNNPRDPGGETKWGISKRAHPDVDIATLTRDDAARIYWDTYWVEAGCEQLPRLTALAVFDFAVNSGPPAAVRSLQYALSGLVVDGVFGPKTMRAASEQPDKVLALEVNRGRMRYVTRLVRKKPDTRLVFLTGWMQRIMAVSVTVMEEHIAIQDSAATSRQ